MLFKQKLDNIQLKKWLNSRLYSNFLRCSIFSEYANSGKKSAVVILESPSFLILLG